MVGKWKIDMDMRPVRLEHINLVSQQENTKKYHVQPRLFLSLKDTFDYIMRHDNAPHGNGLKGQAKKYNFKWDNCCFPLLLSVNTVGECIPRS